MSNFGIEVNGKARDFYLKQYPASSDSYIAHGSVVGAANVQDAMNDSSDSSYVLDPDSRTSTIVLDTNITFPANYRGVIKNCRADIRYLYYHTIRPQFFSGTGFFAQIDNYNAPVYGTINEVSLNFPTRFGGVLPWTFDEFTTSSFFALDSMFHGDTINHNEYYSIKIYVDYELVKNG